MMVTLMSVFYKKISGENGTVTIVEFTLFRCISILIAAIVWNTISCKNPLKEFPWESKWTLLARIIMGQFAFVFFNMAVPLAPLSMLIVVF